MLMHEITQANKCDKALKCIGVRIIPLVIIASLAVRPQPHPRPSGNKGSQSLIFRRSQSSKSLNKTQLLSN